MLKFIEGDQLIEIFLDLMKESTSADLAVAFWGKGSAAQLKIKKNGGIRIICNLESGACNPNEIEKLQELVKIKTNKELHAKVYSTKKGAIIGSSNASTNGLAIPASDAQWWREANIVVDEQSILDEIAKWFEIMWRDAQEITDSDLGRARELWKLRSSKAPHRKKEKTLIAALKANAELLQSAEIYCIVYREGLDPGAMAAWKKLSAGAELAKAWSYQPVEPFKAGSWLISCTFGKGSPSINGYLHVPDELASYLSSTKGEPDLYAAYPKSGIEVGLVRYRVSKEEKADLLKKLQEDSRFKRLNKTWEWGDALIPLRDLI